MLSSAVGMRSNERLQLFEPLIGASEERRAANRVLFPRQPRACTPVKLARTLPRIPHGPIRQ